MDHSLDQEDQNQEIADVAIEIVDVDVTDKYEMQKERDKIRNLIPLFICFKG